MHTETKSTNSGARGVFVELLENGLEAQYQTINASKRKLQTLVLGRAYNNLRRYKTTFNILCLPGITGWDIEYFKSFKGTISITALEDDAKVFELLANKYKNVGNIKIVNMRTSEFLATTNEKFDIIYLDYYTNLSMTVRFDITTIFRRSLLLEMGKLIINIYGARETIPDQYTNIELRKEMWAKYGWAVQEEGGELERCRAFNALIMKCRWDLKILTTAPSWAKYKSNNTFFYTAWLSYNGVSARRTNAAAEYSPHVWAMTGARSNIPEIVAKNMSGVGNVLGRRGLKNTIRDHYKALALKFYEENQRSPSSIELTGRKGYIGDWSKLLREIKLCPLVNATEGDLLNELHRIEKRDGLVSWPALRKARIQRRLGWSKQFNLFCAKHGVRYQHDLNQTHIKYKIQKRINILYEYVSYLEAGKPRSYFRGKTSIRRMQATKYSEAIKRLAEYKILLENT